MPKKSVKKDEERENRIIMEAIVDAYGPEEQAMGWYYYLDDRISFPFQGKCIEARKLSPLKQGEVVEVISMAPEDDCMREMFVIIRWMEREMGVPLAQIEGVDVDDDTEEAIGDWHYWMAQGYELG
jgi:Calcium binding